MNAARLPKSWFTTSTRRAPGRRAHYLLAMHEVLPQPALAAAGLTAQRGATGFAEDGAARLPDEPPRTTRHTSPSPRGRVSDGRVDELAPRRRTHSSLREISPAVHQRRRAIERIPPRRRRGSRRPASGVTNAIAHAG